VRKNRLNSLSWLQPVIIIVYQATAMEATRPRADEHMSFGRQTTTRLPNRIRQAININERGWLNAAASSSTRGSRARPSSGDLQVATASAARPNRAPSLIRSATAT